MATIRRPRVAVESWYRTQSNFLLLVGPTTEEVLMKAMLRACALLVLCVSLVPAAFADDASSKKDKSKGKTAAVSTEKVAVKAPSSLAAAPIPRGSASL